MCAQALEVDWSVKLERSRKVMTGFPREGNLGSISLQYHVVGCRLNKDENTHQI